MAWELRAGVRNRSALIETQQPVSEQDIFRLRKEKYSHVIRKESIDAWAMKPLVATTGMKEGYLIEGYVVKALPEFLRSFNMSFARRSTAGEFYQENEIYGRTNSEGLNVQVLKTVGLVHMKGNEVFGDSPDALCVFADDAGDCNCAVIEIKTMTSVATIEATYTIRDIKAIIMIVDEIGSSCTSDQIFRQMVLTTAYRMDCLHHAMVLGVEWVFHDVAKGGSISVGEIVYVALLHFNKDFKNSYTFCLSGNQKGAFSWIGASCEGIPVECDKILSITHASDIQRFAPTTT